MAAALERLQQALRPLGVYRIKNEGLLFAELSAYAAALSLLDEKMSGLEREAFISTAEDEGLSKRERLFTNEKQSVSLLDRRHMLLYRAAVKRSDFTVSALEKALTAAGMRAAVYENPGGTVAIHCIELIGRYDEATAKKAAEEFLPAHLNFVFDFRRMKWSDVEAQSLTFSQMDQKDMTWAQIDALSIS